MAAQIGVSRSITTPTSSTLPIGNGGPGPAERGPISREPPEWALKSARTPPANLANIAWWGRSASTAGGASTRARTSCNGRRAGSRWTPANERDAISGLCAKYRYLDCFPSAVCAAAPVRLEQAAGEADSARGWRRSREGRRRGRDVERVLNHAWRQTDRIERRLLLGAKTSH